MLLLLMAWPSSWCRRKILDIYLGLLFRRPMTHSSLFKTHSRKERMNHLQKVMHNRGTLNHAVEMPISSHWLHRKSKATFTLSGFIRSSNMTEAGSACAMKSLRSTSPSSLHFPEEKLLSPSYCIIWEDKQESMNPSLGNAVICPNQDLKLPWKTSPKLMLVCEVH